MEQRRSQRRSIDSSFVEASVTEPGAKAVPQSDNQSQQPPLQQAMIVSSKETCASSSQDGIGSSAGGFSPASISRSSPPSQPSPASSIPSLGLPGLEDITVAMDERQNDPMITARVLQLLRRNRPVMPVFPSLETFMPHSDNDLADDLMEDLKPGTEDDAMQEGDDNRPADRRSLMGVRGVWRLNQSADTASRPQRIVRNVPRMRKRAKRKKDHQDKHEAGPGEGRSARVAAPIEETSAF